MRIVIDTNVLISGTFFGGYPRKVLEAVVDKILSAYATPEIMAEYTEIVEEMIDRKQGHLSGDILDSFYNRLHFIDPVTSVSISRDPDDNKFIACAIDSKSYYIVSGDKDLLVLEKYGNIEIVTAADFCKKFLS